eukprot:scaffold25562_cov132-Cylindrotheca_fusiformis.AAC.2
MRKQANVMILNKSTLKLKSKARVISLTTIVQVLLICILTFLFLLNSSKSLNYGGDYSASSALTQKQSGLVNYEGNKKVDILRQDLSLLADEDEDIRMLRHTADTSKKSCSCVKCKTDPLCGKLWGGNQAFGGIDGPYNSIHEIPVHVVVSYCNGDLDYITSMTEGFNIASIHVISKCGFDVKGLPSTATVEVLPNVGRCDHSYAHYLSTVLDEKLEKTGAVDGAIVVFLKDNAGAGNLHQLGKWNSFTNLVKVSASKAGFACGLVPEVMYRKSRIFYLSAHFDLKSLKQFKIKEYGSKKHYDSDGVPFDSEFPTLGSFYDHLKIGPIGRKMVQVCYGGVFAASVKQIKKQKMEVWKAIEKSMSRGDNIQEGHYIERMWGMLLAAPLEQYQMDAIYKYADTHLQPGYHEKYGGTGSVLGAIVKRIPKAERAVEAY